MRKNIIIFSILLTVFFSITNNSWAGSWENKKSLSTTILSLTTEPDGTIWGGLNNGGTQKWNGSSWVGGGYALNGDVDALTVTSDGFIWAGGEGGYTAVRSNTTDWTGKGRALNSNINALTTAPDGSIWAAGDGGYTARWNGSSWEDKGQAIDYDINALTVAPDGSIWAAGDNNYTARWNGSSWEQKGQAFPGTWGYAIQALTTTPDGSIWAGGTGGKTARWNGSSWEDKGRAIDHNIHSLTTAPDGSIWAGGHYGYIGRWNGSSWEDKGQPINHINALTTAPDGSIWAAANYSIQYNYGSTPFNLIPTPNGPSGKLVVNPRFDNIKINNGVVQYSTDRINFSDLYTCQKGSKKEFTPNANNYWFRLKWQWPTGTKWQTKYSNIYGPVPTIKTNPSLNADSGIQVWDAARGRSWVTLDWNSITNISGYKLHIFDGNTYRSKDLGNTTSWDSRTAKIFPFEGQLPENNSISSDIFRWDASGLDLEDTAIRLYKSTIGTSYDSDNRYFFRITAHNQWMETDFNASSSRTTIQLPNATDSTAPGGSITLTEVDEPNSRVTVDISSIYDNQSGLDQVRFSNDGSSYSSWQSFVTSKVWSVPSGDGTKTVYVQAKDKVGNISTFTDTCFFGVTTTQLYNTMKEAESSINSAKSAAEQSKLASEEARDSAREAESRAIEARDSANLAKQSADTAVDQTLYNGTYGGSSESVADVAGYIRNTQLPDIENKIASLQSDVTNIKTNLSASDTTPPNIKLVKGYRDATCTTDSTFKLVIEASDNNSGVEFRAKADTGYWTGWITSNPITVGEITGTGAHTIEVEVRDAAGNVARESITIFKI